MSPTASIDQLCKSSLHIISKTGRFSFWDHWSYGTNSSGMYQGSNFSKETSLTCFLKIIIVIIKLSQYIISTPQTARNEIKMVYEMLLLLYCDVWTKL